MVRCIGFIEKVLREYKCLNQKKTLMHLVSLVGLVVFALLASGSANMRDFEAAPPPPKASVENINTAKANLKGSLGLLGIGVDETSKEIDSSFLALKMFLDEEKLSDEKLKDLETRLVFVRGKQSSLNRVFGNSKDESEELFQMLTNRAEENQTQSLREKMLADIESKQEEFESQIDEAKSLLKKIDESVQKFDDIVGYLQVNKALEGFEGIASEIEAVLDNGDILRNEIKKHVAEGLEIVEGL